jgi:type IV pilus assembly protein PilX
MKNSGLPNKLRRHALPMARAQRGVVLVIALVVLVAMSLGGVAILRSVDTSTLIAGNYAFKQGTLQSANIGIESAIKWITANRTNLGTDGAGYYSSTSRLSGQRFKWEDPNAWTNAVQVGGGADAAGNTVKYVIHRLCTTTGPVSPANPCATNIGSGSDVAFDAPAEGSSNASGSSAFTSPPKMYLRVIARSTGPRNAVSYVQAMVLIPI